ncbi:MAG: hypothetical protein IJ789_02645 [Bacteroidales bacterium]|nr:hypothetical protein [Bacteroidales bacterium]
MTREEQRTEVISACRSQQQHIADVARQEMDSAQQQSNDYGANVDRYDSYRTKMMRARDMYAQQLSNANAGLRVLDELLTMAPHTVTDHGAIVVTNRGRYFMAIGMGKFAVRGETYYAISAQTPVYAALRGHKVGDEVFIGGSMQTITDIF